MRRPRFGIRLAARLSIGSLFGAQALRLDGSRERASPFGEVVLLLQGSRLDRMDLMQEIYGPIFQDVMHLFWVKPPRRQGMVEGEAITSLTEAEGDGLDLEDEADTAWEDVQELVAQPERRQGRWVYACRRKDRPKWQSHCLPDIMLKILERHPKTKGLFACHMDFWFHPFRLLGPEGFGLELNSLWELGPGLPGKRPGRLLPAHFCFADKRLLDADDSWHWFDGLKDEAWKAAVGAQANLGRGGSGPPAVCLGWSDAFYLPQPWAKFALVAAHFTQVWHEVALPTIFRTLVGFADFRNQTFPQCWGDAAKGGDAVSAAELRGNVCGHHLALATDRIRGDWASMMRGETQAAFQALE